MKKVKSDIGYQITDKKWNQPLRIFHKQFAQAQGYFPLSPQEKQAKRQLRQSQERPCGFSPSKKGVLQNENLKRAQSRTAKPGTHSNIKSNFLAAPQLKIGFYSAQAAEAPPFPFGRKRRQKGPPCTASGGTGT
ncbi:MAG TPA: hypothetical protein IAD07_07390 [Candidatus Fimivicinus intestinavium]|nr:hypothetical protein [Candidatus Fimivicinus intestinavium]